MSRMGRKQLTILLVASMFAGALPLVVGAQQAASGGTRPAASGAQPAAASGADAVCIGPAAHQTVETCPTGAPPPDRRAGAAAPASHLTQAAAPAQTTPTKQGQSAPSIELSAAQRRGAAASGQQRALELLRREIQTAERIVGRLRAGDARGADVLLRLAETYFELQTYWNTQARSLDERIFQAEQAHNADQVRELRRQQQEAEREVGGARENAIRTYARLVQDYPNYQRMDEVLFSLAFGLEEMRQFDRARQVYNRLIKGYPNSRFVPYAWLSFAEYYFGEGDMSAARQFYAKVLESPPEQNPVYGFALYKQAWVLYNLEDFRGALQQFVQVLEFVRDHPDARDAENMARQTRRELVMPYARVGRPNQALQFFQRYATNQAQAYEMLESLAELYFDTGQWPETIQVYHTLMAEQPNSDRLCYWQSRVTNAIISSRPKAEQVTEVQRLVDLETAFRTGGSHPQAAISECRQATSQVLFELAVAWHREAIGTDSQPGTNDRNTMQQATQLYQIAIEHFPDMEQLEFPDIARDDWPTLYRVSYFYAELLWRMEDWTRCGPAFDRVVELNPQGEYTSDAAYAAVLCYNNLYQQQYAATERETRRSGTQPRATRGGRRGRQAAAEPEQTDAQRLAVRDFSATEQGMLNAFQRFVCYVSQSDELPQVKYRRARIFYESNHFEEAALIFRDIAMNYPQHELAEFAANLYLDSLNAISRRDGRVSCVTEIKNNIEPLFNLYCNSEAQLDAHADLCGVLQQLRCDVLRQQAELQTRNRQYREAAATYVDIFRRYRECGRLDEVLYNAAINYESARLLGRAIRVRTVLIERFPDSELAKRAVYLVGANYHALAIYSQAASFYEQFARRFPGEDGANCTDAERTAGTCAIAHVALENAVFFRLGLGEEQTAIEDAQLYERNYRRTRARETSQVIFSLGSIYERQGNWNRVFDHYRTFLRNYGRTALPHEIIRANVQMGRAQWELERRDQAEQYFRAATQAWARAEQGIAQAEGSDEDRQLWLARAREATSEALFYLADYKFNEFRAVRFPAYRGPTTLVAVNRWAQTDLFPWLQRKFEALRTAEAAYNLIEPLQIPQWQIAAAARVGVMYRTIIDDVRSAPIPDEISRDPELEGIYLDALENVLNGSNPGPDGRWDTEDDVRCSEGAGDAACQGAPIPRALGAFEYCLTLATRVRWFNEYSAQCEQELNQLDRARFPLAAELRGTASFVQNQVAQPEPVELSAGEDVEGDTSESGVPQGGDT